MGMTQDIPQLGQYGWDPPELKLQPSLSLSERPSARVQGGICPQGQLHM